ncbi:zinc-dependent alcohol dehydrogenase family protein [Streptomyces sp. NPDC001292]|uniref:zinc-dependent alcohol dehydrogenase family protein n=1 Tax=Streptomyces sp. NPDC001292 TaxID=3364558 RepID=UPI0036C515D7
MTSKLVLNAVGGDLEETITLVGEAEISAGAGEVVVNVEAAPINGADPLFAMGWFGVYPEVPADMGAEGVGRVVEVGPGVDPALVGRRVVMLPTFRFGTWATRTVVPVSNVVPVPEEADPLQLAMLAVNPATAYVLLHEYVDLQPGDWVGLNLANSAVAHYLIPLARRAGVRTLAVVRREEVIDEVRRLGADVVLVDGDDLAERMATTLDGARLRVLYEGTGDPAQVARLVTAVEDGGTVVAFSSVTGQAPVIPLPDLIYRGISLRSVYIVGWLRSASPKQLEQMYGELAGLITEGVIGAEVAATYPLEEHVDALRHAQQTERNGKVLFVPAQAA